MEEQTKEKTKMPEKKEVSVEKQILILFAVLFILFAGFLIAIKYANTPKSESFEYKDFTIHKTLLEGTELNFYFIKIQVPGREPSNLMFRNDPRNLTDISINLSDDAFDDLVRAWVTFYPHENDKSAALIAAIEVERFLSSVAVPTKFGSVIDDESSLYPFVTCEGATRKTRTVEIRLGNKTGVYSEGDCIVVEGENFPDLIRAADRLAYHWLEELFIEKVK